MGTGYYKRQTFVHKCPTCEAVVENKTNRKNQLCIPCRIKSRSENQSGCWVWTGSFSKCTGYGMTFAHGKSVSVHRLSYEHFCGPVPVGQYVCHRCDNRRCVNPDHLFLGSQQDNMDDCQRKNRRGVRGKLEGDWLSAAEVRRIRADTRPRKIIAAEVGRTPKTITRIRNRQTFRDVPDAPVREG